MMLGRRYGRGIRIVAIAVAFAFLLTLSNAQKDDDSSRSSSSNAAAAADDDDDYLPSLIDITSHAEMTEYVSAGDWLLNLEQPLKPLKCTQALRQYVCGHLFACVNGVCAYCTKDSDCGSSELICRPNVNKHNMCVHKPLFPHFDKDDALTSFLVFIGGFLAAGGGIGGGGLFVPIFILVSGFGAHIAVPLSKCTIFGGAIANFLLNFQKSHPRAPDRPMIDYDVALILEPMTLAGTIIGVMFNVIFPAYLIVLMLVTLLGFTAARTLDKAMSVHRAEEELAAERAADGVDSRQPIQPQQDVKTAVLASNFAKSMLLIGIWILVFVSSMVRGGHGAPSVVGIVCGTFKYWLATFIVFPTLLAITYMIGQFLHRQHEVRKESGHTFVEGDIEWNARNTLLYPVLCMIAGVAAGLLGIGGGMVKGPLLLEMGVLPLTTAATSAFMILFTSSSTTMQFAILGMLPADYGIWYGVLTFVSTLAGQLALYKVLDRWHKASVVIFLIGGVIAISTVLMGYVGFVEVYNKLKAGVPMGFNPLCHH